MKKNISTLLLAAATMLTAGNADAQAWRAKTAGLPMPFTAKAIYGEGHSILVSNAAAPPSTKLYYTPDSTTAFTGSASYFGLYAALETGITRAHGKYFMGGIGGVFTSSDNGTTWSSTAAIPANYTYALYGYNDTLWANAGSPADTLSFSTDDGASWTRIASFPGGNVSKMLKHNGTLYVGTANGIYYTADNGGAWDSAKAPSPLAGQSITGLCVFQGAVYACCVVGVYKTTDNGASWTQTTNIAMNCMTAVDTSLICGTSTNGVYQSNQAATVWTAKSTGLPIYISTLYSTINDITSNSDFIIASSMNNNGIWVMKLSDLGLLPNPLPTAIAQPAAAAVACTIAPNPAAKTTTITWDGDQPTTISVVDMAGRILTTATVQGHSYTIDVTALNPGNYLVQVTQGAKHTVQQIVVAH